MIELREIRAYRLGLTFQSPFVRDPFRRRFERYGLLLWALYGIAPQTPKPPKQHRARKSAPASAPVEFIWPTRRYEGW